MPIIEFKDLTYCYDMNLKMAKPALDNVSFSIGKGEFLAVVGSNGSGKSTLIQQINGLLLPTSGTVTVLGTDTSYKQHRNHLWKHVGLVFQYPEQQIFEGTVFDEIAYGLKNMELNNDDIKKRVSEAAQDVGLHNDMLVSSPFSLSGGFRRRVAIASILAMKPEILILDEPTAGLDAQGKELILTSIKNYQTKYQTTVIMVSHDINDLILLSDSIAVLDEGKLMLWGKTKEVLNNKELIQYEVLLPEYLRVLMKLKAMGWKLQTDKLTVQEAHDEICRVLSKDTNNETNTKFNSVN